MGAGKAVASAVGAGVAPDVGVVNGAEVGEIAGSVGSNRGATVGCTIAVGATGAWVVLMLGVSTTHAETTVATAIPMIAFHHSWPTQCIQQL